MIEQMWADRAPSLDSRLKEKKTDTAARNAWCKQVVEDELAHYPQTGAGGGPWMREVMKFVLRKYNNRQSAWVPLGRPPLCRAPRR